MVGDSTFGQFEDSVNDFVNYCRDNDYDLHINLNKNDLNIGAKTDIVVSFTKDYDIENIIARENIIRILVCDDSSFRDNRDYDIFIEDSKKLSEEIFSNLYSTYLDS